MYPCALRNIWRFLISELVLPRVSVLVNVNVGGKGFVIVGDGVIVVVFTGVEVDVGV